MAALVLLASALTKSLKQNDKMARIIIYSLVIIFVVYFFSNLFDALGATSQIHPVISKGLLPAMIFLVSIFIYQLDNIKSIFNHE